MKRFAYIVLLLLLPVVMMAEPTQLRRMHKHELRIGYGDPLFETSAWYDSPHRNYGVENHNFRYTGHVMAEYQYRPNQWFGLGAQIDYEQVLWDEYTHVPNGETIKSPNHYFFNLSVIPTARFTYYHSYWINLYSSLGCGLLTNSGTELDYKGRKTAFSPVVDVALLGVSLGHNTFFTSLEFGGMFAMTNTNTIYMIGSRMFTATIGVRF